MPYKFRNNCDILYPSIKPLKKFPKKQNIIIFTGKLNSSKGYDVFGNTIIKILDNFINWRALVIGNEPREKYNFHHERLKILDWIKHDKILNYYKKASISVVPSKWQEPFGRTAMESAAYGCSTITSKNGGLPETFRDPIFLNNVNEKELYKKIKKLIENIKFRKLSQRKNFKSVLHTIKNKTEKLDILKNSFLISKSLINLNNKLKILHVSTFDERNNHRLFNISISNKLSKGFIRNNHDVINFSYRDYISKSLLKNNYSKINDKVLSIADNYRPNYIVLGHNNVLTGEIISKIKKKHGSKFTIWYEDALGSKGQGQNWKRNLKT